MELLCGIDNTTMKSSTKIFILTVVAFLIGSALTCAIMQLVLNPEVQQSIANEKEVSYDTDSNQSPSKFNSISELDEKAEPAVVIYQNVEDEPERIQALLKDFQENNPIFKALIILLNSGNTQVFLFF